MTKYDRLANGILSAEAVQEECVVNITYSYPTKTLYYVQLYITSN